MSLKRNTIWNFVGAGLPLLVGVVTIPYLVQTMGVEAFGILTLIWALIGYFSLFDFGLGRALTQRIAACRGSNKASRIAPLAKAGLLFTLLSGLLAAGLLAAVARPLVFDWLKVSPDLSAATAYSLLFTALGVPLTTLSVGLRGISEAYEDFKRLNLIRIALGVATFALPALSVALLGPSLEFVVIALILARLFSLVGYWVLVNRRLPAGWRQCRVSFQHIKHLGSFGAWMTVSNIVSPIMVTADRFVIAGVLGASVVAFYTVPAEMMMRLLILPGALTAALFPRLASLLLTDNAEANVLYKRCMWLVAKTLGPICLAMALGSYWGLALWLGAEFAEQSWLVVCIMSLGILLNGLAYVPFALVQAAGKARYTAIIHLGVLCVYVPLLLAGIHFFGVEGAALAWAARAALDLALLLGLPRRIFASK